MRYHEPDSVAEVVARLQAEPDARCLAGGATLVAMMNADLVSPTALLGLRRVVEMHGISQLSEGLRIGAMTTHREVAAETRLEGPGRVVRRAAGQIAHPAIRNVGTIGGAICHGDPSTDLPAALVAAGAGIVIAGPGGDRVIDAEVFFVDYLETALAPAEIVTAVLVPQQPRGARSDYLKFSRVEGDYATVSVAVVLEFSGPVCVHARIALGACGPRPLRVPPAEARLVDSDLAPARLAEAGELLAAASAPLDDVRGSAGYRRRLITPLLSRAVELVRAQVS